MRLIESNNKLIILSKKAANRIVKEKFTYLILLFRIIINYFVSFIKTPFFVFKNKKYHYFYHPYNHTWANERAIEIPIIMDYIKSSKGQILEIGNVLNHYFNIPHDIVDKYEKGEGIINEDVVSFKTNKKYYTIISISTMEHVGWDEEKDAYKIPKSINNLRKLLRKEGKIIITVPVNYNLWLDKLLEKGDLFDEVYFMKRKLFNRWKIFNWKEVKNCGFSEDARGLAILIIKK